MNFLGLTCCLGVLRPKKKFFFSRVQKLDCQMTCGIRPKISFFGHFYLVKHDTCGMLPSTGKCIEKPEKTHLICDGQKCKIPSLMNFLSTSYTWGIWSDHSFDHLAFTTKTPLFTGHFTGQFVKARVRFFCTRYRERAREARTRAPRGERIADHLPSA